MCDEPGAAVLLLRGVNVGGHNRLAMAQLGAALRGLGLRGVATHIQSGNAVFHVPDRARGFDGLSARIALAVEASAGFRPEALVLPRARFAAILAANPFAAEAAADGRAVHVGFLARPSAADLATLSALAADDERCALTDAAFYLHAPSGIGRSKLAAGAERCLGVPMTMRNARVLTALAALLEGMTP